MRHLNTHTYYRLRSKCATTKMAACRITLTDVVKAAFISYTQFYFITPRSPVCRQPHRGEIISHEISIFSFCQTFCKILFFKYFSRLDSIPPSSSEFHRQLEGLLITQLSRRKKLKPLLPYPCCTVRSTKVLCKRFQRVISIVHVDTRSSLLGSLPYCSQFVLFFTVAHPLWTFVTRVDRAVFGARKYAPTFILESPYTKAALSASSQKPESVVVFGAFSTDTEPI